MSNRSNIVEKPAVHSFCQKRAGNLTDMNRKDHKPESRSPCHNTCYLHVSRYTSPSTFIIIETRSLSITVMQCQHIFNSQLLDKIERELFECLQTNFELRLEHKTLNVIIEANEQMILNSCQNIVCLVNGYAEFCSSCVVKLSTLHFLQDRKFVFTLVYSDDTKAEIMYTTGDTIQLEMPLLPISLQEYFKSELKHKYMIECIHEGDTSVFEVDPQYINSVHELYEQFKTKEKSTATTPILSNDPISETTNFGLYETSVMVDSLNQNQELVSTSQPHTTTNNNSYLMIRYGSNSTEIQTVPLKITSFRQLEYMMNIKQQKILADLKELNVNLEGISEIDKTVTMVVNQTDCKGEQHISKLKEYFTDLSMHCTLCHVSETTLTLLNKEKIHFTTTGSKTGDTVEIIYGNGEIIEWIESLDMSLLSTNDDAWFKKELDKICSDIVFKVYRDKNEIKFMAAPSIIDSVHRYCKSLLRETVSVNEKLPAEFQASHDLNHKESVGMVLAPEFVRLFTLKPELLTDIKRELSIPFMIFDRGSLFIFPKSECEKFMTKVLEHVTENFLKININEQHDDDEWLSACEKWLHSLVNDSQLLDKILVEVDQKGLGVTGEKNAILKMIKEAQSNPNNIFHCEIISMNVNIINWIAEGHKPEEIFKNSNVLIKRHNDKINVAGLKGEVRSALDTFDKFMQTLQTSYSSNKELQVCLSHAIDPWYLKLFSLKQDIQNSLRRAFDEKGYKFELGFSKNGELLDDITSRGLAELKDIISRIMDHKILQCKDLVSIKFPAGWYEILKYWEKKVLVEVDNDNLHIVGLKEAVNNISNNFIAFISSNIDVKGTEITQMDTAHKEESMKSVLEMKEKPPSNMELKKDSRYLSTRTSNSASDTQEIQYATLRQNKISIGIMIGDPSCKLNEDGTHLLLADSPIYKKYYSSLINSKSKSCVESFDAIEVSTNCLHVLITKNSKLEGAITKLIKKRKCVNLLWDYKNKEDLPLISSTLKLLLSKSSKTCTTTVLIPREKANYNLLNEIEMCAGNGGFQFGNDDHYFQIVKGHIQDQKTSIIVNSTTSGLNLSTGAISAAILSRAGHSIQTECNKMYNNKLDVGEIAVTGGGSINTSRIFHVNIGHFDKRLKTEQALQNISSIVKKCLELTKTYKAADSIAFPTLGIGNLKYPLHLVAKNMITEIDKFLQTPNISLKKVLIVVFDKETKTVFSEEMLAAKLEVSGAGANTSEKENFKLDENGRGKQGFDNNQVNTLRNGKAHNLSACYSSPTDKYESDKPIVDQPGNPKRSMSKNHELRCIILKFELKDVSTTHIQNILLPEFSNNGIEALCIVSPYEDDPCAAFISFKNTNDKIKACQLQLFKKYKIVDIKPELLSPILFHVNIEAAVLLKKKSIDQLTADLKNAAGVYINMNEGMTINIEGCQQQIKLVDTWFGKNIMTSSTSCTDHGGARPKDTNTVTRNERTITISSLKYKALEHLYAQTMKSVLIAKKTNGDEIQLFVHQNCSKKTYEDIKDIIYSLKHEYMEIPEDKISEAYTFIDNYDNRQTLYFEVNDDTQCMHVLGTDYNAVDTSIHKAKLAVGLLKVNNKNRFDGTINKSDRSINNKLQNKTFVSKGTGIIIHVQNTDITTLVVDVVVNAANGQLAHGGGVAYCISKAGGKMLERECSDYTKKYGDIPVSGICKTTGGDMKCKQVFHTVGPCWFDYSSKTDCEDDLCKTIIRCLVEADKDGYNSIAIPSISSAIFGVPEKICANMYWKGFKGFETFYNVTNLKEIYFVDIRDEMLKYIQSSFDMFLDTPLEETEITKIKTFINDISPEEAASNQDVQETSHTDFPMTITIQTLNSKPKMVCKLQSNVEFHIYQASVKSTTTQSIVSWEDKAFSSFNASSKWILDSAGDDYKKERLRIRDNVIAPGSVATTSAGQMTFKFIFHIVSVISPSLQDMEQMIENLFLEVQEKKVKSVTIGLVPDEYQKLFTSILKYLKKNPRPPCLEEIHFVTESEEEIKKLHEYCNRYVSRNNVAMSDTILECPICLDTINNLKTIPCGHTFCQECIDEAMKNSVNCPICRANVYGDVRTGNQPDGRMEITQRKYNLPGYNKCGTIVINYIFKDGIQTVKHPNPGVKYYGTTRTAYLPDNPEGKEVLRLLKIAWERKLIFTVGQSVTTGVDNAITWNEIHHKTNMHGGPENHGYPDPGYLQRVKQELLAFGVTALNT